MSAGGAEPVFRRAVSFFLAGCCLHSSVQAACGNIVVMSLDAQYMVLAPDTLRTLEVGSLWWLGINDGSRTGTGSSQSFSIIATEEFMDLETDRYILTGEQRTSVEPPLVLIPLEDLGKNLGTQRDLPFVPFEQNEAATSYGPHDIIVSEHFFPGIAIWEIVEDRRDILQMVDQNLRVIRTWEDPNFSVNLRTGFCPDGNLLYFRGVDRAARLAARIVLDGGEISSLPLATSDEEGYTTYKIDPHSCAAMGIKRIEGNESLTDEVYFDFHDQRIISSGIRYRYVDSFFFNEGANILNRYLEREESAHLSHLYIHTDRFLTLDTESLSIVKDVSLDAEGAHLSGELICEPESPKAVLRGRGKIGLVDLNNLSEITWKKLPWEFFTVFQ